MIDKDWEKAIKECKRMKILCGAGISLNSGLPLAQDYLRYLFNGIGFCEEEVHKILNYNVPFESWMQLFIKYQINGESLLDIFRAQELVPCQNHRFIAKLVASGIVHDVYTANFDMLIEKALCEEGLERDIDFKVFYQENQFANIAKCACARVIKFHGSAEDYSSVRVMLDDIVSNQKKEDRYQAIAPMVIGNEEDVLFVFGYSCSDSFDVQPCLKAISQPHAKILFMQHSKLEDMKDTWFEKNWPSKEFENYSGYRIEGQTDLVVKRICELYNLHLGEVDQEHISHNLLLSKYTHTYFDSFISHDNLLLLRAEIYRKIGFSENSQSILKDIYERGESFDHLSKMQHMNAGILLQNKRSDKALEMYRQEMISLLSFFVVYNGASIKIFPEVQQLSNDNYDYKNLFFKLEKILSEMKIYYIYDFINDFSSAFLGYCSCLNEIGTVSEAITNLELLDSFYEHFLPELLSVNPANSIKTFKAAILNELALSYTKINDYQKALLFLENSLIIKRQVGNLEGICNSLENMIEPYTMTNNFVAAQKVAEEALMIRESLNNYEKISYTLINLMILAINADNPQIFPTYIEKVRLYIDKYPPLIPKLNIILPHILERLDINMYGHIVMKLLDFMEGHISKENSMNIKNSGEKVINLAKEQQANGFYQQAYFYYNLACYLFKKTDYREGVTGCMRSLGILLEVSGYLDDALDLYFQSLEFTTYPCIQKARTLAQIGLYYSRIGEKEDALNYTNQAMTMFESFGDFQSMNLCQLQLENL